jgi:hypothetical protein
MDLSNRVCGVRRVLFVTAGVAWAGFVTGTLIASGVDQVRFSVMLQGLFGCTTLSGVALLSSVIPQTGTVAAEGYVAGWQDRARRRESSAENVRPLR